MKKSKWTPHIIAVITLIFFIVLGLACATNSNERYNTIYTSKDGLFSYKIQEYMQDKKSKTISKDNANLLKYLGNSTELVIPETIDGILVYGIGRGFARNKNISSLIIPSTVCIIEQNAFSDNNISSIIIPSSVRFIGEYAFSGNPITDFTINGNFSSRDNILNDLTGYYYLNKKQPGQYTKNGGKWFFNDKILPFNPVKLDTKAGDVKILSIDGINAQEFGCTIVGDSVKAVFIPAGKHTVIFEYIGNFKLGRFDLFTASQQYTYDLARITFSSFNFIPGLNYRIKKTVSNNQIYMELIEDEE